MKPVTLQQESRAIVYDGDVLTAAGTTLFDAEYWRAKGAVEGDAPGRGTSLFIRAPFGEVVLRRYLRGGWVARLSRDRYLFTGLARARPFREFHLLRRLREAGLRVPAPVAALCERHGPFYRAALMTRRIPGAHPLAERLDDPGLDWGRLGHELRRFHQAGVDHADLNARNILLEARTGDAWLLDFDRSRFTPGRPVDGRANLSRLRRSLRKLWPGGGDPEPAYRALLAGYGR